MTSLELKIVYKNSDGKLYGMFLLGVYPIHSIYGYTVFSKLAHLILPEDENSLLIYIRTDALPTVSLLVILSVTRTHL